MADGREFDLFDPINELVRAQPRLVRDTVVIGGAAMMDWLLGSQARDPGRLQEYLSGIPNDRGIPGHAAMAHHRVEPTKVEG